MLTAQTAERILSEYGAAWVEQDPDKILTLFAEDGTYHEHAFHRPKCGHAEIRAYWQSKVCEQQSDIHFIPLVHFVCGDVLIAEWDAFFKNASTHMQVHIREVAIMEIANEKIVSLREYWQSAKTPLP